MDAADVSTADVAERWTSTVVLSDGTSAVIRPITPEDADALETFHEAQSSDSRYLRYFSPKPTLTDAELERFTNVDFVDRAALVVEEHGNFIGWGSYERWKNRNDADVAFMVDDRHHGQGIATLLLEHLAAVARHNGISGFTAQTMGENRAMLAVFAKAGWPLQRRFDSGVIDVDFSLDDTTEFIDSVERREQRADSRAIARLLLPTAVAVIGASDREGTVGESLWRNATRRPRCPVFPVNPAHDEVGGVTAFRSILDVPHEIGLALIAVPEAALRQTIDECIEKRVRGAVVVTAVTDESIDVEALVTHARRNGLRIIGPSSMGVASPRPDIGLQGAVVDVALPPGRVAISMQSGTLGSALLRLAAHRRLGTSWFVSLGDKRDVSANDLLQFWEDDDATAVVALYTESLGNPRKFARIARRVSRRRPIVAVRTGAALLGAANAALFQRTGVIEVPTVTALLDTARVFASQPLMAGNRVAVLCNAANPEQLAAGTLAAAGLEVVPGADRLDWRSDADDYARTLSATLADEGVDAVLVIHAPSAVANLEAPAAAIAATAERGTKPVVTVMLGADDGPLPGSQIPNFAFPEQAAAAIARIAAYSHWRRTEGADHGPSPARIDPARASAMIDGHLDEGTMSPQALRVLLGTYGVPMSRTELVPPDDAVAAADRVGYPVAVKAIRRHLGRSAEAGVALDLGDPADVAEAVATMVEHLGDDASEVLVQPMAAPGVDLRVHAVADPRLGPVITAGLGGVQADAIGDESSRLAPISPSAARSMIESTRAAIVLDDAVLDAVAETICRVAQLASDHPEVAELDINPLIVSNDACIVTDARVVLRRPERVEAAVRRLE
ncbi:MAG: GNAT family N-acetyltransferase [Ilumatobacter sp.]|uniref:bifunctional acetate--CoA ligase family protein/GNAT family N-acetyltransferase n=1 Tax=Ilumatobacter sp. TaxID=1967498 RepID=UPI00261021C0|nr:GNAT family N-acetyltransferase [Ilumatobacter sp.]MDJ0768277.1 GNAT family N-acetyltransferase [Ilumatobacter sp.]